MKKTRSFPIRFAALAAGLLAAMAAVPDAPAADAPAADGVILKPQLTPGLEYVVLNESDVTMKIPAAGTVTEQTVNMEQQVTINVEADDDDTGKSVSLTINFMKLDMNMPGMAMTYDSTDPASAKSVLGAAFKDLINQPIEMVFDENDELVKMSHSERLSGDGASPFGHQIGKEELKQMVTSSLHSGFPDEAVKPGDKWIHTMAFPLPSIGEMEFEMQYVYNKDMTIEGNDCAMIDFSGTMKTGTDQDPGGDEAAERRIDEGFEESAISGTMAVDKELRLVRETDLTVEMTLKMPSPLGGEQMKLPMKSRHRSTVVSVR